MLRNFLPYLSKPRNWPTILIFFFAKLITFLPISIQVLIGRAIGVLLYRLASRRKKIARTNIQLCFPDKTEQQQHTLLKENFALTGLALIETSACWFSSLNRRSSLESISGSEHLENAISKGKGVILLSFHMTSLELGCCLLSKHYPISGMYKPNKEPLLEHIMTKGRLRHLNKLLKQNEVRSTIKALRNNEIVWYAADQNYGSKSSIFIPFFGIQASTITATTKFAKLTGATVIPFTQKRTKNGQGLELTLHPALDNFTGENEEKDALQINQFLEKYLDQYPEDYMWIHQRFRSRPAGEPPIY